MCSWMPARETSSTLVIIPAWNEAASIRATIDEVRKAAPDYDIVVVDDGSSDQTLGIARSAGVVVLPLPYRLGVGGAMRTGFRYAWSRGYGAVVQVDADGQHDARDLSRVVAGLEHADICIGSRFSTVGIDREESYAVDPLRRLAMGLLNRVISRIARSQLTDVTSGFRAANRTALAQYLRFYPLDYLGDTIDSLVAALRSGIVVSEVPVRMRPRRAGQASSGGIRSALYLVRAFAAILVALTRTRTTRQAV